MFGSRNDVYVQTSWFSDRTIAEQRSAAMFVLLLLLNPQHCGPLKDISTRTRTRTRVCSMRGQFRKKKRKGKDSEFHAKSKKINQVGTGMYRNRNVTVLYVTLLPFHFRKRYGETEEQLLPTFVK